MFGLAPIGPDDELHYWSGGEIWDTAVETAVRFPDEVGAEATIDVLRKAGDVSPTAHVVELPE